MIAAWIPVTIAAAFVQNLRFMLQRHVAATGLSPGGATFARFVFSFPLVALVCAAYLSTSGQPLPGVSGRYWGFAALGGVCQILATICVVALFARRNFAVGMTFKKAEALLAALVGVVMLGERISAVGTLALCIGFAGLVILSDPPGGTGRFWRRILNPSAGLGLLSGLFFAFSANSYRGATLAMDAGDAFLRASLTLALVTGLQTLLLGGWLLWRERGEVGRVLRAWRVTGLVGLSSMAGSLCWFTAYALQTAAYVNALGQVELIFSFLGSRLIFGERTTPRELLGMAVLMLSVLMIVLLL